jgi:farnesyl diphosphate synthase
MIYPHHPARHHLIVLYKTAFYSFYLPVALAMRMVGITDESLYKQASSILLPLGEYFQVQDDYLDAFGKPEVIGKIGTDIQDNKCSWPVNVVLLHANAEQRKALDQHYGRKNAESEQVVKDIYVAPNVDIPGKFEAYEKESYQMLTGLIDQVDESKGLKKEVFTSFLNKVCGNACGLEITVPLPSD